MAATMRPKPGLGGARTQSIPVRSFTRQSHRKSQRKRGIAWPTLPKRGSAWPTPRKLQALMWATVLLSLAWGGLGAWTVAEHSGAASSLARASGPAARQAQLLYLNLASADTTITQTFLTESQPLAPGATQRSTLAQRQAFSADLAAAASNLAAVKGTNTSARFTGDVTTITGGLTTYAGDVSSAQLEYTQGYVSTGESFMSVASEEAHLMLLPAAADIYQIENASVSSAKAAATGLPSLAIALVVAVAALAVLAATQLWLARKTHRVFNVGLLLATAALLASGGWLLVTVVVAGSELSTAIGQGENPASALAQASIDVQRIRGDAVIDVIARSGSSSLPADSAAQQANVGHLLREAQTGGNTQADQAIRQAMNAAPSWYTATQQSYTDGQQYKFSAEEAAVSASAAGYDQVDAKILGALADTEDTFSQHADAGVGDFGPLAGGIIAASLLMAAASAWGLLRRLRDFW